MVEHWDIKGWDSKEQLYTLGYHCSNGNVEFLFTDEEEALRIAILFPITTEYISIEYLENTLSSEDRVYNLMLEADCAGPVNPFFILSDSILIEKVKNVKYSFRKNMKFLQYTMVTCDYWVDIVSSIPPTVSIRPLGRKS